ncbi:unnamed protein product [Enterobius vermicularis]|uniref:2'-phosphotransferase n=1 Tax=Enterobius vermicularis TaxID=51028 RepID=A0A0N4UXB5_ENTVE|nr:unnamed protein product [Enterobius vermicularis]
MVKLNDKEKVSIGRFLSLILRHKPAAANITLDNNGWANVDELLTGVRKTGRKLDLEALNQIVADDSKRRFIFSEDHSKIRASQGHSVNVDVELKEAVPPQWLYHGTARRSLDSIMEHGLQKRSRLFVHLSADTVTAEAVGKRHGPAVVLQIDTSTMHADGYKFYLSENDVWLCDCVPKKYIVPI